MYLGDTMTNIIDLKQYQEKHDPDYALKMVNRKLEIRRKESENFKKAKDLKNIKFASFGVLVVLGDVICAIGIGNSIITNNFSNDNVICSASILGIIISSIGFVTLKKEILEAYKNLCFKFKEHRKRVSEEELEIFREELTEIVEQQLAENQGATIVHVDNNPRRR